MQRVLSFERSPPLSVPLRFFLTAPVFAVAAGVLVAWYGPQAFDSRWSPVTLALTHLLTLGFVTMSMIGALIQILHVVAGVEIPYVRSAAAIVHSLLAIGTVFFVAAFLSSLQILFQIALFVLLGAFTWFLGACLYGLLGVESRSATLSAIRLSLLGLAFTAAFGVTLAGVFGWGLPVPFMLLGNLHVASGLLGWVGLLVVGVAYQVVPMFQVTPTYPALLSKYLAYGLFLLLCLWELATTFLSATLDWLPRILLLLLAAGYAAFAITTIHLLRRRKRKAPDATTLFWLTGLIALLGCVSIWLAGEIMPNFKAAPCYSLVLGVLFVAGFAYSTINGMLYKIVPFLVWYHLQNQMADLGKKAPNVKLIISDNAAFRQFFAHLAALLLLVTASISPVYFARVAGVAFIGSSIWLWINLLKAARIYRDGLK